MSTSNREPLATFNDEQLVEALVRLTAALWQRKDMAHDSFANPTVEEIDARILDRLAVATVAAWDHIGQAVTERLAQQLEEGCS